MVGPGRDVPAIASKLGIPPNSVVGRLYHHLDPIYAQEPDPTVERKGRKSLFMLRAGSKVNCINFPLMEAVLANLAQERRRDRWTIGLAVVSLGVSRRVTRRVGRFHRHRSDGLIRDLNSPRTATEETLGSLPGSKKVERRVTTRG